MLFGMMFRRKNLDSNPEFIICGMSLRNICTLHVVPLRPVVQIEVNPNGIGKHLARLPEFKYCAPDVLQHVDGDLQLIGLTPSDCVGGGWQRRRLRQDLL